MVDWRECKLGDLLQIKHGFAFKGEYFASAGTHVVLTPGNFLEEGGFKEKSDKAKWYNGPIPPDYVLNKGDLIVAMTEQAEGLLGSSALIPRSGVYLHNQRLGLVQICDHEQADQHFIYYLFNSIPVRQQIRGSASGTKIRHTAPLRIADVKIQVPPLPIQQRIAGILSAYDELIENSQRRIKILESMARALYREWFVYFRFPGHENHPRIASPLGEIPQGWEVKKLGDMTNLITKGTTPTTLGYKFQLEGINFVKAESIEPSGILIESKFAKIDLITHEMLKRSQLCSGDILFSIAGVIGRVCSVPSRILPANTNQALAIVRCASALYLPFLYMTIRDDGFRNHCLSHVVQTAQANVSLSVLKGVPIVCPPNVLLTEFNTLAESLLGQIQVLSEKIQNLRRTRDLLLPRLLSGQLDVEALNHA